jgi:hypothetical protein
VWWWRGRGGCSGKGLKGGGRWGKRGKGRIWRENEVVKEKDKRGKGKGTGR